MKTETPNPSRGVNPSHPNRRDFLTASAGVAAAACLGPMRLTAAERARAIGANERIRIGVIGCGHRGIETHMASVQQHAKAENLEVVAVCDPWRLARERAAAKARECFGTNPTQCRTHEELLALREVDAVFIASCDHWHAAQLEAAAAAGKHVYVEKPMANELGELLRACDVARQAGVVIQVGTQTRSSASVAGCRELVKAGTLGKLSRIEQVRNGDKPYWYSYLKPEVKESDVDWKTFTKGLTDKPFDPIRFTGWYGHWEFSQGPVPQWGVHFLDTIHHIADLGFPESCVCLGGIHTWKDEHRFTTPDQVQALWVYPQGVMVSYATNFGNSSGDCLRIGGERGTLEMGALWGEPTYSARGGIRRDGSIRGENKVTPVATTDHWVNWYRCMRDGKTPRAPLEAGFQHSIASIMATISLQSGRRTHFDPERRTISQA